MVGKMNYNSVPLADLETNQNHTKYTVNRDKAGGLNISKPLCTLMGIGALLLAVLVGLLVFFFVPRCTANQPPESLIHTKNNGMLGIEATMTTLDQDAEDVEERLPKGIQPTHYRLQLWTFLENQTTQGALTISLLAKESSWSVLFHVDSESINIEPTSVQIRSTNNKQIPIKSQDYIKNEQLYRIDLDASLEANKAYTLELMYTGKLNQHLLGYYSINYNEIERNRTNKMEMASTQFSPIDARKAFPCFDEPSFKANFTVSLARPSHMISLANMPLEKTEPETVHPGWEWDHYQTTPKMSTYLVAFMVHNLQGYVTAQKSIHTWARHDAIAKTSYAAEIAPKILSHYEQYFGSKFPLPKTDIVAVPEFGFQAMENWGLITFRESTMLVELHDPEVKHKRQLADVLAHELAHQWFGNLATPQWWGDLWMKEGFASYLSYMGMDAAEPSWNVIDEFILEDASKAFALDSYLSSRPISTTLHNSKQIRQTFDALSYSKGACVIRMLHHILGETTFRQSLTQYLTEYAYSNANAFNLFAIFTSNAHRNGNLPADVTVNAIMDSWTQQPGFPVITAILDRANSKLILGQKRFLFDEDGERNATGKWWVPLSFATSHGDLGSTKPRFWMREEAMVSVEVEVPRDGWYLLNVNHTGHFIVNYDEANWRLLTDNIMTLPPLIRAQLVNDAMDLARANLLDYDVALKMAARMIVQDSNIMYVPTTIAWSKMEYLGRMLATTPAYGLLEEFQATILKNMYSIVTADTKVYSQDYFNQQIRRNVLKWASGRADSNCAIEFHYLYRVWMQNPNGFSVDLKIFSNDRETAEIVSIPSNIQEIVYCAAIRQGGEAEWNFAYDMYGRSNSTSVKQALLNALGCTTKKWLLSRYLDKLVHNDSSIKIEDASQVFESISQNMYANGMAFDFLRLHWDELRAHYGDGFSILSKMVESLPVYMNSEYQLDELIRFKNYLHKRGTLGATSQAFKVAIEKVRGNVEWMRKNYINVERWLNDHKHHYNLL